MRDRGFGESRQLLAVLLQRAANRDGSVHRRVVRAVHVSRTCLAPLARARDVRQGKLTRIASLTRSLCPRATPRRGFARYPPRAESRQYALPASAELATSSSAFR